MIGIALRLYGCNLGWRLVCMLGNKQLHSGVHILGSLLTVQANLAGECVYRALFCGVVGVGVGCGSSCNNCCCMERRERVGWVCAYAFWLEIFWNHQWLLGDSASSSRVPLISDEARPHHWRQPPVTRVWRCSGMVESTSCNAFHAMLKMLLETPLR